MIGKVLGNRYEIVEKIGSGGMSYVYKARCRLLNRYVAVKVLRPEFTADEEFVKKFRRESRAAASLSHQNIVSIYDVGIDGDIYYIVMEYVEGKTLKQVIKEKQRLMPGETAEIAKQVCKALEHAHKNHIIHRDIKPHNILITKDGTAKVTDFGIARAVTDSTVTNTGNVIGSVHYFSPEQARGGYIDEKSDLYSLGIVMYEMVTGKVPFEGESPISIALKHLQEPFVPPGELAADLPRGLEQIIIKATKKETAERYNSAREMLQDLNAFINNHAAVFDYQVLNNDDSPTIVIPAVDQNKINKDNGEMKMDNMTVKAKKKRRKKMLIGLTIVATLVLATLAGMYLVKELLYVKAVEVPDIVGDTVEEATEKLASRGLDIDINERRHHIEFPEGTIISQYPKAGEKNKVTNPVLVIVSRGPEKTEVPDLINKSSYEAQLLLQEAGLKEGEVELRYSEQFVIGFIMDQNPRPGLSVDQGTAIDLVVSAGEEPVETRVPDVIGLKFDTAKKLIENAGLILGSHYYQESAIVPEGYVISQSIEPESLVEEGTSLVLGVSSGSEIVEESPPSQVEGSELLKIDLPENAENIKVTVKKYESGVEETVYQRRHDGDEGPLYVEVRGRGIVRVVVLFNDIPQNERTIDFSKEE